MMFEVPGALPRGSSPHSGRPSGSWAVLHALAAFLVLISATSCQQPTSSWSDALEKTAPPNAESSEISSAARRSFPQRQAETGGGERSVPGSPARAGASAGEAGTMEGESGPDRGATLVVELVGDPNCFVGTVRCYIDGRFLGRVGEDRRFSTAVPAGNHLLEVWDSRGSWRVEFTASIGQVTRIPIRCEGRNVISDF